MKYSHANVSIGNFSVCLTIDFITELLKLKIKTFTIPQKSKISDFDTL